MKNIKVGELVYYISNTRHTPKRYGIVQKIEPCRGNDRMIWCYWHADKLIAQERKNSAGIGFMLESDCFPNNINWREEL